MSTVTFVMVDIRADSAFCIAAPEFAGEIDRPVARHPRTRNALVPASGLIGSLRAHAESSIGSDRTRCLFGSIGIGDDEGDRSLLRALGASLARDGAEVQVDQLEVRRQTAIDRTRGAAATSMLRTSQAVTAGASIRLYLEVMTPDALEEVLAVVTSWVPTVGGGRTTGLGVATVTAVHHGALSTDTEEGMHTLLSKSGPELVEHVAVTAREPEAAASEPLRTYRFTLASPLLVRGEVAQQSRDGQRSKKVQQALHRNGVPHIDGSTWKGVFRSGCEYVLGSIAEAEGRHLSPQTIELLFGARGRRGLLTFAETTVRGASTGERMHVSVDRITGGARDNRLFQDEPVQKGSMQLTITASGEAPAWVGELLDAVAMDIHDGLTGVGGATSRGYGSMRLDDPPGSVNLGPWVDELMGVEE